MNIASASVRMWRCAVDCRAGWAAATASSAGTAASAIVCGARRAAGGEGA